MKRGKRYLQLLLYIFTILIIILWRTFFISAAAIGEDLHLNIQTLNSTGITTGTFNFTFNISTTADCANVVYTNFTNLTTDSRGIVSYYLENVVLNFSDQYWLCYYRDGVLINNSKIVRTPYTYRARNITLSGIEPDSNFNMGIFNLSAFSIGIGTAIPSSLLEITKQLGQNEVNLSGILYVNSTSGNVGIGTTSPTQMLHLSSTKDVNILLEADTDNVDEADHPQIQFSQDGGAVTGIVGYITDNELNIINNYSGANGDLYLGTGGKPNMIIKYGGNIGMGTLNPNSTLEINSSNANGAFYVHNNSAAKEPYLFVNGTNGNVGIGTTSPGGKLEVVNDNFPVIRGTRTTTLTSTMGSGIDMVLKTSGDVTTEKFGPGITLSMLDSGITTPMILGGVYAVTTGQESNGSLIFVTRNNDTTFDAGNDERMRIDNKGNVGIGTANPTSTLEINSSNANGAFYVHNNSAAKEPYLFVNGTNGNVGIGTTSPVNILTINGTTPAITLLNSGTTGSRIDLYNQGTYFQITNGVQSFMAILNASGNVGIGTKGPDAMLSINGGSGKDADLTLNTTSTSNNTIIRFKSAGTEEGAVFALGGASPNFHVRSGVGMNLSLDTNGVNTPRMFIDVNGNVGIGTANPTSTLEINSSNANGAFYVHNNSAAKETYLFINGTNGFVGIGTTTPTTTLTVNGGILVTSNTPIIFGTSATSTVGPSIKRPSGTSDINFVRSGGTSAIYINDTMGVGIGTATPLYPFVVNSNTSEANNSVSAWFSQNISASGFIDRTSVYDKSKGTALNYIQDASYYLNPDGTINHKEFYGYVGGLKEIDYSKPIITITQECSKSSPILDENGTIIDEGKETCNNVTSTTYGTKDVEGVDLGQEIAVLRQAVYELKQENTDMKKSLCVLGAKEWC